MRITTATVAALLDAGHYDAVSEADFTGAVIALAQECGWRCAHFRASRTARGWRTAVQGDGVGFVDILAVRGCKLLAWELKSEDGTPTPAQNAWLLALAGAGVEVAIMRPSDWAEIKRALK